MYSFLMGLPGLFLIYFRTFSTKNNNFYNKLMLKIVHPVGIRRWNLNSWPLEHETPPITTRPRLPPYRMNSLLDH